MNIIYIHTHDSGRFIQPYGHAIPTPNLMRLAEEGVLFRKCFSCAPTCSPSRVALLTGMNPHSAGMLGLTHRGFSLNNPKQHLAHHLKLNGFETVLCGVQHVITPGEEQRLGYTRVLKGETPEDNLSGIYREMAQDYNNASAVSKYLSQPSEKPFFLSFGMISTHFPLPEPTDDINPAYIQVPPTLPDSPEIRKDMAGYHTLAKHADRCIGNILRAIQENELENNTLVIFTTDHGIAFPWMKCNLFDHGIGVSLILRFPKKEFKGKVIDSLVSHLDIFPTICELLGIETPSWLEGFSLMPLIRDQTESIRNEIFGEVTYHAAYEPMRCIRTERYKFIQYFGDFEYVIKPNIDDSRSKRFLLNHGLANLPHKPSKMLFDLYFDPCECDNLVHDPNYSEIQDQMENQLQSWMEKTNDPISKGDVPLPANGYTNPLDGNHPS
jgi:arylsulfatase A-like enzyme